VGFWLAECGHAGALRIRGLGDVVSQPYDRAGQSLLRTGQSSSKSPLILKKASNFAFLLRVTVW
jgi:hypothetical protein